MIDIVERLHTNDDDLPAAFLVLQADAADEILRLRAENARLREALKPFALKAKYAGDHYVWQVFVSELRAAHAAMGESDE